MNPINSLFKSRKFLLLLLDTVVSLILLGVGSLAPGAKPFVEQVITILQPVFVAVILGIAIEDGAANINNARPQ